MEKTIQAIRSLDPFCREYVIGCLDGEPLDDIFARLAASYPGLVRSEFNRKVRECRKVLLEKLTNNPDSLP